MAQPMSPAPQQPQQQHQQQPPQYQQPQQQPQQQPLQQSQQQSQPQSQPQVQQQQTQPSQVQSQQPLQQQQSPLMHQQQQQQQQQQSTQQNPQRTQQMQQSPPQQQQQQQQQPIQQPPPQQQPQQLHQQPPQQLQQQQTYPPAPHQQSHQQQQQPQPQVHHQPQQQQQMHQQSHQPQHQYGQQPQSIARPYSPYQNTASPGTPGANTGIALPPSKRQRLSPNPSSPQAMAYASPDTPYHTTPYHQTTPYHPNATYNNTYSPMAASPIAAPSPPPFNAPQPHAASPVAGGAMGPPPRPNPEKPEKEEKDKIHDISDVTDVFHGSGIDLREEENYMSNTFRNTHAANSYSNNSSFNSATSGNSSFGHLNSASFSGQPAFSGSGPVSLPPASQEDIEKEVERKHIAAARELAVSRQQHLKDSFLVSNRIRHRMHQIAYEQGVALNVEGLFDKIENPPYGQTMTGPNGQGIVAIQDRDKPGLQEKPKDGYLQENAALADILSLVSIAANERLRTLVDDSYRLARGRRYGTHGLVPPDLADLAVGENPKSAMADPNLALDPAWEDQKKGGSDGSIKSNESVSKVPTISFSDTLSKHLVNLAIRDRDAEKERIRKRQERAKRAAAKNEDGNIDGPIDAPVPAATGASSGGATPMPDAASQIAPEKPLSKKERERQAKMGQTEEVLHKNANTTAAMALGLGKRGKKYSWLSGGAPAAPSNPYKQAAKPAQSPMANGTPSGKSPAGSTEPGVDRALQVQERKWGGWREDGIEGRGIQMRDWIQVLERDGREKKALQKALLRLDSPSPTPAGTPGQ